MLDGRFTAKAKSASVGESDKGNLQVAVVFQITQEGEHFGEFITYYGTASEAALEYLFGSLDACGWKGDMLSDFHDLDDASQMLPTEVELNIELDTYNGKTRPKVKFVNRIGGVKLKYEGTPQQLKTQAAGFKAQIQAMRAGSFTGKGKQAAASNGQRNTSPARVVDDIPF